jgi:MtN3 and saliva related transmembrane protein
VRGHRPAVHSAVVSLTAILAPICTAIAMVLIWPQVIRVYKLNSVEGIAPIGTLHGITGTVLWVTYGVSQGIIPVVGANIGIGVALVLIGAAQSRHGVLRRTVLVGWLAFVVVAALATLAVSPTLTGWLATVVGVTSILPQVAHAARTDDLSAVSRPTYMLICASTVIWSVYGALIGDVMVIVSNVLIVPCAAFVLVQATRSQAAAAGELASVVA